jgi:hypothetical protein
MQDFLYNIYIVAEGDKCTDSNLVHRNISVPHGLIRVLYMESARCDSPIIRPEVLRHSKG